MKDTDKIQLRSYQLNYQPRPQGFFKGKALGTRLLNYEGIQ